MTHLNLKTIYRSQLIFQLVALLIGGLSAKLHPLLIIGLAVIQLLGLLQSLKPLSNKADKMVTWGVLLTQLPTISLTLDLLGKGLSAFSVLFLILALPYFLLAIIPTAKVLASPKVNSNLARVFLLNAWGISYLQTIGLFTGYLPQKNLLAIFLDSGLWQATAFSLVTVLLMRAWQFPLPDWKPKGRMQTNTILIIIGLAGLILLGVISISDFRPFNLTWGYLFTGIRAGLLEEIWVRYALLLCLLRAFRTIKSQRLSIMAAVLLSSFIFGSLHFLNLTSGQDFANTLNQVIYATAIGVLFALIYLYTGKLSLLVGFHALVDIIYFSMTSSIMRVEQLNWTDFITTVCLILVSLALSYYMMTGKRWQTLQNNSQGILEPAHTS
ncbi:CPBP family intramembrane glutamic endopeptidase [Streptococcus dentasini]